MPSLSDHLQQRALLDQLRASDDPQARQQAAQLRQLYHDREMAGLADDVYDAAKGQGQPEAGWIRASGHLDKLYEHALDGMLAAGADQAQAVRPVPPRWRVRRTRSSLDGVRHFRTRACLAA